MTNIIPLHPVKKPSSSILMDDFVALLKLEESTVRGEKSRTNVWKDVIFNAYSLPVLAMDPLCVHNEKIYFASTFEGAAALCTQIFVHDLPQLSAFGPALYDGHMLYVSLSEFNARIINKNSCAQWLRDGCGAIAAHALGMVRETQWVHVDAQKVREIMHAPQIDVSWWDANPQRDAYRYFSAIKHMCAPLEENIPEISPCDLNAGVVNQEWQSALNAWNAFHQSSEWNTRLTQKSGFREAGRLLGNILKTIEQENLEERFIQLAMRTFTPYLSQDENLKVAPIAAKVVNTKQKITRLVQGLTTISKALERAHLWQNKTVWHQALAYSLYGRFLDDGDPHNLALAVAAYIHVSPSLKKQQLQELLNSVVPFEFNHEHLNVLSQCQPQVVKNWNTHTPDDGTVVHNLLTAHQYWLNKNDDGNALSPGDYIQMVVDLIQNGWLGFNADLKNPQVQQMWREVVMFVGSSDDPCAQKLLPSILAAAQQHAPDFASHVFISLVDYKNASLLTQQLTQTLFEIGANWNTVLHEKTLAQDVVECEHVNIVLKTQARRAMQEQNRKNKVVQLIRK